MQSLVVLVAVFLALLLLRPVLRLLIALFGGRSAGKAALAKVPDIVHLTPAAPDAWQDEAGAARLASRLVARGFEDGGTFAVREMSRVTVRLLEQPVECVLGMIYEHPQAGQWVELTTRYADGTSYSVTSNRSPGVSQRPGHVMVHAPGADPEMLHKRFISGRPQGMAMPLELGSLAAVFEQGHAEHMAWRKAHGITRTEVAKVATRKVA